MLKLERILCPVDFSPDSRRALDYAIALADWSGAALTVLHVVSTTPIVEVVPSVGVGGIQPMVLTDADCQVVMGHLKDFLPDTPAAKKAALRVEGAPDVWAEILAQAEDGRADLLVVGSHGRSGVEHLLLGSTTEKLLRKSPCPVLVVPHQEDGAAAAPQAAFRRIVCPIDFSDASLNALERALELAEEADAQLTLLHVIEMPPDLDEMRSVLNTESSDIRASAEARALERLRQLIPESAVTYCSVSAVIVEGSAHREIVRVARDLQADLIVMGVHGRGAVRVALFGSNTHAVLRRAPCPVLTVHA